MAGADSTPPPRASPLLAFAVAAAAVAVALAKLPWGMFWPDEGFYLSSSYRLLLGDRPFRDEISYASSWFFVVLTPILALLPDGGTVVQVRLVGFAIRVGAAAVLFASFRRTLAPSLLACALAVTVLANYPSLWVPNYNSLPFDLGFLSLACWMAGARSPGREGARAWGAAAGVLFGLSCLCYLPRLPLFAIPAGALAWARRRKHDALRASSSALLAGAALVLAAAAAALLASGLGADFADGVRFQARSRVFTPDPLLRLTRVARAEVARAVPSAAVHLVFGAAALALASPALGARRVSRAASLGAALVVAAYAAALTGVYVRSGERSVVAYASVYTGLCWLPLLVYPLLRRRLAGYGPDVALDAGLLFWMGAGQQAVAALTSTQLAAAGIPGLAASLLLLLLLWEAPRADGERARPPRAPAYGFAAGLAVTAALFHFYPGQSPLRVRAASFEEGRLRGLRTSRRYVRAWTGIVDYLGPRVRRGEFLLAYGNIALLHYLTDTRPALRASYVAGFMYGGAQQARLVEAMVRDGRVPRYAVRLMPAPADEYVSPSYSERREIDPVNAFVMENYELEARVPPFEVFRRRPGR